MKKKKIVVADDNESNLKLALRFLNDEFEVLTATNGKEAIDLITLYKPNLVLMDLDMPIINGLDATRELKKNESTKDIPIIALTAHALSGDRTKALEAGCDAFEAKPVDYNILINKIFNLIDK